MDVAGGVLPTLCPHALLEVGLDLGHAKLVSAIRTGGKFLVVPRVRLCNLGRSFLASKVPSDTQYISPWCINLSEIWDTFDLTRVTKGIKMFA